MMMNRKQFCIVSLLALSAPLILAACHHNPPAYQPPVRAYKKQPAQAAVANMQLALEYMRLGKLATARECIEKALKEDSSNPAVQDDGGHGV